MANKIGRWGQSRGIASLLLGVFLTLMLVVVGVVIAAYQQVVATRQVVTATATAALRAAVPGGFITEAVAQSQSHRAVGLVMSALAYDLAVKQTLPTFWPGSQVQRCTVTPQGSPISCTPGSSYLVTLPATTARALNVAGPIVVSNVQLVASPPYQVTHFGHTTNLTGPAVAADVAVPLHITIASLIHIRPWVESALTNLFYADQGGQTGGSSRFLYYGSAPTQGSGGNGNTTTSSGMCWSWPNGSNPACATRPSWCPVGFVPCFLSPGRAWVTPGLDATSSPNPKAKGQTQAPPLSLSAANALPWIMPAANQCWQEQFLPGNRESFSLVPPGQNGCGNHISAPSWANTIYRGSVITCYAGLLPGSPTGSAGPTTAYYCVIPG